MAVSSLLRGVGRPKFIDFDKNLCYSDGLLASDGRLTEWSASTHMGIITMSTLNPDDWFLEPNNGAYEKTEERTGPPLEYIAEKLRKSLEACHEVVRGTRDGQIASMHASAAFRYGLVGYLGMQNLLALVNEGEVFDRLENYTHEQFIEWLDRIDRQGSVTG